MFKILIDDQTRDDFTLNGTASRTKFQFLVVPDQKILVPASTIDGIRVGSLEDIMATKLSAVMGRPAFRDYFDIMILEKQGGINVESGLGMFLQKNTPADASGSVQNIIRALSYMDDVDPDPALEKYDVEVRQYWRSRHPTILKSANRFGSFVAPILPNNFQGILSNPGFEQCPHWMPVANRQCSRTKGHQLPHR
jgi:hypothetical protein